MRRGAIAFSLPLALSALAVARPAAAATTTVGPGETLTLTQNLVLADGDVLDAEGTPENPCVIEGGGFSIDTAQSWQGQYIIRYCTLHSLGTEATHAISISAIGTGKVLLEGNTFDASAGVIVTAQDVVTVDVLRNTVLENSLAYVDPHSADNSIDAFLFQGYSNTVEKHFQGNRIFHARVKFEAVQNWLVGGYNPGEGNVHSGARTSYAARGANIKFVGNYIRVDHAGVWNQLKPLELEVGPYLVEHNIFRDGNWLVDTSGEAEIRYNLMGDSHDRPWLILENADNPQKVHHNVFMRNDPTTVDQDGVWVNRAQDDAKPSEIYNNTFYGGGNCWARTGAPLRVTTDSYLASLRSNAFVGFGNGSMDAGIVRGQVGEPTTPPPPRLGYADYNLFFNPRAAADNYAIAVVGKQERVDPGFALNDAPVGGAVDSQIDPGFAAAKIPVSFPFKEDDIKAGTVTVCQMLAFYRSVFAPGASSPLIGAGDPADGAGNNIGAITTGPDDQFGLLCAGGDIGTPDLGPATYTCPALPPIDGGPGGHGFVCVCELGAPPTPASALASLLAVAWALLLRRRR